MKFKDYFCCGIFVVISLRAGLVRAPPLAPAPGPTKVPSPCPPYPRAAAAGRPFSTGTPSCGCVGRCMSGECASVVATTTTTILSSTSARATRRRLRLNAWSVAWTLANIIATAVKIHAQTHENRCGIQNTDATLAMTPSLILY